MIRKVNLGVTPLIRNTATGTSYPRYDVFQRWCQIFGEGIALYGLKQYSESLSALAEARKYNTYPAFAWYHTARSNARLERKAGTFSGLDSSLSRGSRDVTRFREEEAFSVYIGTDVYAKFELALYKAARPCEFDPRYRQLDFWIGEWEVFPPAGVQIGSNRIEQSLAGAVIIEN
jgi:hypothetical protein